MVSLRIGRRSSYCRIHMVAVGGFLDTADEQVTPCNRLSGEDDVTGSCGTGRLLDQRSNCMQCPGVGLSKMIDFELLGLPSLNGRNI